MTRFGVVHLHSGSLHAEIQPDFGGRLLALYDQQGEERIDWLVPARPASAADFGHIKAGCFPMVPYCNRIADGRFDFEGTTYDVGARHPWEHACHGHGFLREWQVDDQAVDSIAISYEHRGADWPSAYRARQRFRLSGRALEVSLSLENIGSASMPAGFGLHPYFPGRHTLSFSMDAERHWPILPGFRVDYCAPSPFTPNVEFAGSKLAPGDAFCLSDWRGLARLAWPKEKRYLELLASNVFTSCVLFVPLESDAFCIEPSSHVIGALKALDRREETGLRILGAGESLAGAVTFACHLDGCPE